MKTFKYIFNSFLLGVLFVFFVNYFGQYININIPVNVINIMILGMLRVPGLIVILIILKL